MSVMEQLEKFASLANVDQLRERVAEATKWIPGPVEQLIPSTTMQQDGIVLESLFLLAGDYLAEVRVSAPFRSFDITRLAVRNINVERGTLEILTGGDTKVAYQTAKVLLMHSSEGRYGSTMHYAGKEPADEWLDSIRNAFPANRLVPIA